MDYIFDFCKVKMSDVTQSIGEQYTHSVDLILGVALFAMALIG